MIGLLIEAMRGGEVSSVSLPYEWVICEVCGGEGKHSRHLGIIEPRTWNEWDDDEREGYMSGFYDRSCDGCVGSGKVRQLAEDALPADVVEWIESYRADLYESAMMTYYERRAGC